MTDTGNPTIDQPLRPSFHRDLPLNAPFSWLKAGVRDTFKYPASSLAYGIGVFLISVLIIGGLFAWDFSFLLLPALAGFMVVGPAIAVGLYEKSRRLSAGEIPELSEMVPMRGQSLADILFVGVILMLLMILWLRAAFLLYALFFGIIPFSGFDQVLATVFATGNGWALLVVGSIVGGLFAAFSFAISAFSIPMIVNEDKGALTAMGLSFVMAWSNKSVAIVWGAIVVALFAVCLLTALVGLIVVFPILGHGTWHAYVAVRGDAADALPNRG